MLCACSGEQFKLEEPVPQSPESLATRDFSASGISSRTGTADWESKLEDAQVDEAESTLKEALTLNYEEARALLGRLEYQKGNFDAALQVFHGIDIRILSPKMSTAIAKRTQPRKLRSKGRTALAGMMSLHSVSLLLEAILLKAKSLAELGRVTEAAKECKMILDTVEAALPNGVQTEIHEDAKLLEMFHRALELLPQLWIQSGSLDEAIVAYRRALVKHWNMEPQRLAKIQKDLAATLLYGGVEATVPSELKAKGSTFPENSMEESILLLFILMHKILCGEIEWDQEVINHLAFALTMSGNFETLANHVEQVLPGVYDRAERWYFLALCYSAAGQDQAALSLLKRSLGLSEAKRTPHIGSFLLGAKLCSQDSTTSSDGINFARAIVDCVSIEKNEHVLSQAHKFLGICYGNAARVSISDFERAHLHKDSLSSLNHALVIGSEDPDISFNLGLENAVERNLALAFEKVMLHSKITAGSSAKGWKLLALIASAEQRLKDAESIVDLALDETGGLDQLELLRLKAVIQIAQEQPKQASETYRILLALIQGVSERNDKNKNELLAERQLELETWLDLAGLYSDHKSWHDVRICLDKAKATDFYSARAWQVTGKVLEVQGGYKEAIVAYSLALSIDPNYVPSIISTAEVLIKIGHDPLPIAKSFLMNALRLEPMNHDAWLNLGIIYKKEGLVQQAADAFQAAHELKLSAPVQSFELK